MTQSDVSWYDKLVNGQYNRDALLSAEENAHLDHDRLNAPVDYYRAVRAGYDFLIAQCDHDNSQGA